jgi:hypothetical protein
MILDLLQSNTLEAMMSRLTLPFRRKRSKRFRMNSWRGLRIVWGTPWEIVKILSIEKVRWKLIL